MITGFNKKELRLFEKYRNKYNFIESDNCNILEFSHILGSDYYHKEFKPCKKLVRKNYDLMYKHAKPVKMPSVIKFNPDLIF